MSKRNPVQFNETMWERLNRAASNESKKKGHIVTVSAYVRSVLNRHLVRKGIK